MILGLGLDVCEVARIRRALEASSGPRFRARVFTPAEQVYCEARRRGRFASYAARFAAKEAAMKAFGTGWAEGIGWLDLEVVRAASGPPRLVLHGAAATLARRRGMRRWHLTLSHTDERALAAVVVEGPARRVRRRGPARRGSRARGAG